MGRPASGTFWLQMTGNITATLDTAKSYIGSSTKNTLEFTFVNNIGPDGELYIAALGGGAGGFAPDGKLSQRVCLFDELFHFDAVERGLAVAVGSEEDRLAVGSEGRLHHRRVGRAMFAQRQFASRHAEQDQDERPGFTATSAGKYRGVGIGGDVFELAGLGQELIGIFIGGVFPQRDQLARVVGDVQIRKRSAGGGPGDLTGGAGFQLDWLLCARNGVEKESSSPRADDGLGAARPGGQHGDGRIETDGSVW